MGSHSWVVQVGTGQSMGRSRGGITGGDLHSQRYFCPYDDLEACKPDPKHGVELSEKNLRPCRSDALSNPKASVVAGEDLFVSWMGNGHVNNGQSDGTCVRLMLADFARDPSFADFAELPGGACVDYWHYGPDGVPETSTFIQVPINTKPGTYTLLWYWNFTDFWYSSCADIEVSLDSDGSSVTTTSGSTTTRPQATTTAMDSYQVYMHFGCNAEGMAATDVSADAFCNRYVAAGSYCKTWQTDECGRASCHGGGALLPCGHDAVSPPSSAPAPVTTTEKPSTTSSASAPSNATCGDELCQSLRSGSWCRASNGVCQWTNVPCQCT